ncbi:MAG: T9SS type A sorting domain-containing protein [Bacteroidales bacterium]|nr:T9SS type A sorting domain-containing protein [Bacteroidales bacterium]
MLKTIIVLSLFLIVGFHSVKSQTATAPTNGNGTFADPYEIETLENLYWISANQANWNKYYIQVADIDASETSTWFSGAGWLPIGDLQNAWAYPPLSPFMGKYDGQGYEISNLYINRPSTKGIGLFGSTRNSKISNVNLLNASITGGEGTAGICGASYIGDTIEFCFSSGTITGARCVAGIAGNVWVPDGQPTGYVRISNCYSSASISGNTECGGIVGRMSCTFSSPAEIINSYATGDVTATTNWAGGLVGYFYSGGKVQNCYSTGIVTGPNSGGMVGPAGSSTWTNCFWDTESSGKLTSARGTGKITAEMKNIITYTNATWDFQCESANGTNDFWGLAAIVNNGYPFLSFIGEISDDCYCVWEGDLSQDWETAGNWISGECPDINKSVIIPQAAMNFPILAGNSDVDKLEVENNASLILLENAQLTIDGGIINEGTITLKSSILRDASLITNGTNSGSGLYEVERYLTANQWHLVSSPITAGTASVFNGIWLRPYDESTNTFGEYTVPDATPMPTGQGFSVWTNSAETRTFFGIINNGSVGPLSAQLTGIAGANTGWNLMGNPYPSAIDWDAASGWTKTNLANAVYVWNGTQYATYIGGVGANGGSRYIAPTQGFFVQATSAGASLTMNNDVRVHNSVSYLKETNEPTDIIRLNITANGYSDETVLALRQGSLNEFDPMTDAVKLAGISDAPMVYTTKDDGAPLAINCVNSIYNLMDKVVSMNYAQEGEHILNWNSNLSQPNHLAIYDMVQNVFIPQNSNYAFFASYNDPYDRFTFVDNTLAAENINSIQNYVLICEKELKIVNIESSKALRYNIYNTCGKIVLSSAAQSCDISGLAPGIYNVVLEMGEEIHTQKVFIR